jgi:hypothetical protein
MTTTSPGKSKTLSPIKWVLGLASFVVVIVGSIMFGHWVSGSRVSAAPAVPTTSPILYIIFAVLGVVTIFLGLAAYAIVYFTHGFTFNFDRPYYRGFARRMWFVNLIVGFLLQAGVAFMLFPVVARVLSPILPSAALFPVSYFGPFVLAQLVMIWFLLWSPVERAAIRRRMGGLGIVPEQMRDALPVGISDPAKNSLKKLAGIEEDVGMLWLSPDNLIYRGDQNWLSIPRDALLEIERKADAGATSSYFGAVHVILRYRDDGAGEEKRVRLHPQGNWTMTGHAHALNDLAERLESWRISPQATEEVHAVPPDATGGFPVRST